MLRDTDEVVPFIKRDIHHKLTSVSHNEPHVESNHTKLWITRTHTQPWI